MKKNLLKPITTVLVMAIGLITFQLAHNSSTNVIMSSNALTKDELISINLEDTNEIYKNSITPQNYKGALHNYMKKNSNKFDISNPSKILTDFMNEYNLDYITVSNYIE